MANKALVLHCINESKRFFDKHEYLPEDYERVAAVEDVDGSKNFLEYVFERTNSITSYWGYNHGVKELSNILKNRSTSVGDIIAINGGDVYMVASMGFRKLEGLSLESV